RIQLLTARSNHKLADTLAGGVLTRVLLREPLIQVVVAIQHHVGVRAIQRIPEWRHARTAVDVCRGEPWMVPISQRALVLVSREVTLQPAPLRARTGTCLQVLTT